MSIGATEDTGALSVLPSSRENAMYNDRYRILEMYAQSGMGIVYRAYDTKLGRDVALKVVRPGGWDNPTLCERFLQEARALAAVHHDHVVDVYDYGERDGAPFITMPLLVGETLETRLKQQGPLPPTEVVRIGTELASGLAAVHEQKLIHRDLKPGNVWLEAPNDRVKLLDFGLARNTGADEQGTNPGSITGTPAYMSPEQANGLDVDARSDLFSLGSVLYKAATGHLPFTGPSLTAILAAITKNEPAPARTLNPAVPDELSDLIRKLHRKKSADRPQSAVEVMKELHGLSAGWETTTTDWKITGTEGAPRPGWSRRARLAVSCALGLLAVLGIALCAFVMDRPTDASAVPDFSEARNRSAEPLRIRALEILHLEHFDDKKTKPRRLLGTESFGATPDDEIKVTARLSRPAYSYLIVFRPDGKDEALYPQGAEEVPERTDTPRYPSRDRSKVYGLTDGTGLWLVALVASEDPLPAYAKWRKDHPGGPWAKSDGEANVVWLDDGRWLEAVTPQRRNRGERGEKEAAGTAPIVRVVDWLKAETSGAVSAVGFTVEARK